MFTRVKQRRMIKCATATGNGDQLIGGQYQRISSRGISGILELVMQTAASTVIIISVGSRLKQCEFLYPMSRRSVRAVAVQFRPFVGFISAVIGSSDRGSLRRRVTHALASIIRTGFFFCAITRTALLHLNNECK